MADSTSMFRRAPQAHIRASSVRSPSHAIGRLLCVVMLAGAPAAFAAALPDCTAGSRGVAVARTTVPTWTPTVGEGTRITQAPPQQAGQVVWIRITYAAPGDSSCDDDTLHSFALHNTDGTPGGLSVNVKGHAQPANGLCHVEGFYRNEDVPGMHQGWIETYFGALPASELSAERYCLAASDD